MRLPRQIAVVRFQIAEIAQIGQTRGLGGDLGGPKAAQLGQQQIGARAQRQRRAGQLKVQQLLGLGHRRRTIHSIGAILGCRRIGGIGGGIGPSIGGANFGQLRQDLRPLAIGIGLPFHQRGDLIARGQGQADQRIADRHLTRAHPLERGFKIVNKARQLGKAKHRTAALDRVQIAEHLVDQPAIARRLFQVDQAFFQAFQQLGQLFHKDLGQFVIHQPSTFLITASSLSWVKGFTIQPRAPAARA